MDYKYDEDLGFEVPNLSDDDLDEIFELCEEIRQKFLTRASQSLVELDNLNEIEMTTDNSEMTIAEIFVDENEHAYMLYYSVDERRSLGFSIFDSGKGTIIEGRSLDTAVEKLEEIVSKQA